MEVAAMIAMTHTVAAMAAETKETGEEMNMV